MSEVYRVYNTLSRTYGHSLVFATMSNCLVHGYGSQQSRRLTVTPHCRVSLALACDIYRGNGKGIHNVEIPPVRMSVCPAFG
jgi:hypothetical protein